MEEVLGFIPWGASDSPTGHGGQRAINNALIEKRRVSVVSCNGSGKTKDASALIPYFLCCYPNSKIISVAPTWPQVTRYLWGGIREFFRTSKLELPGKPMTFKWELGPSWWAIGQSTDREENFQGAHATDHDSPIVVIIDEASGVKPFAFDAIKGYLTTPNSYVLYIGNGNKSEGPFYESHRTGKRWERFTISAMDVPEKFMSRDWIEEMREDWGEESMQWQVRVLGRFPTEGSVDQLFPEWLLKKALDNKPAEHSEVHIGLDVARQGGDFNVLTATKGDRMVACESWQSHDLMVTAKNTIELAEAWGLTPELSHRIHVDATGLGAGVVDRMAEAGWGVDAVQFGSRPMNDHMHLLGQAKFRNRKAELHWIAREKLVRGLTLVPEHFKMTWRQLQWLEYEFVEGTETLQVKPKKTLAKKGIEDSPDFAESWLLTHSRCGGGVTFF
jgi:hypothetical protein